MSRRLDQEDTQALSTATLAAHGSGFGEQEQVVQSKLLAEACSLPTDAAQIARQARDWTEAVRADGRLSLVDAMLDAFGLAAAEGKALMRMAEALLRTPDRSTAWRLLCESLCDAHWRAPSNAKVTARVAAVLLRGTARLVRGRDERVGFLAAAILGAARHGVRSMAKHFIVAETVPDALARMRRRPELQLCSLDCLGESARTAAQAQQYFERYEAAIDHLGRQPIAPLSARHSISVKLSALEPRFGPRHRGTYGARLIPKMLHLARLAASAGIGLTVDAEEQDRLESTLDVMAALIDDPITRDWPGLGLAVQAYGLNALRVIAWVSTQARECHRCMSIRLVKGAYWDSEIKRAHERGLGAFPVFTDKRATDVSYLIAAQHLFDQQDVIFPQFATHNALTVASVRALAPAGAAFEFQRLHGMGEPLYRIAARTTGFPRVRVYAPVGSHEDLLAYLIRRLLENGANSSFVRHFRDAEIPVETLLQDPVAALSELQQRELSPLGGSHANADLEGCSP
jgi:RHH-type proline utilization regulon transcriptional repressor/proline dehydrogenase/delta 1-pyrroline-5-carboxylate dehydrogenase